MTKADKARVLEDLIFPNEYRPRPTDADGWTVPYHPPKRFLVGRWYCVARFQKRRGGDGQSVEIDERRSPARSYRLRARASTNSIGAKVAPFALLTGTGEEARRLVIRIALAAADGMIGIDEDPKEE